MAGLKLIALDSEDLAMMSAQVQDAITKPTMLDYVPKQKQFSLVMNRFAWDAVKNKRDKSYERRGAALVFAGVTNVRTRGIKRGDDTQTLSILAVQFFPNEAPGGVIEITFSNDALIHLDVECVEARLDDLGSAWETKFKPRHPKA